MIILPLQKKMRNIFNDLCKYDQITTPEMRITSKDLGLYPQGDKYFFGRMT